MAADALRERLRPFWPSMVERIGERWDAFEAAARAKAAARGLAGEAAVSRYVGLCLVFGPGFEDKPENEWALAVLADARLAEWVKVHQLTRRAVDALRRRGGDADGLAAADAGLLSALDVEIRRLDREAAPLPRTPCDLEAADLRVMDEAPVQPYRLVDGTWQRVPAPAPASLRIDARQPAPPRACVLARAAGDAAPTRLQLRQILHGGCDPDRHPATRWLDARGLAHWHGHEARAVSWEVATLATPPAPPGLGTPLVEETFPAVHLLEAPNCGVRDDGVPLGSPAFHVLAYPAAQWLHALRRRDELALRVPAEGAPPVPVPTRVRLERDGQPVPAPGWAEGFDTGLRAAFAAGVEALQAAWAQAAQEASVQAEGRLLAGDAVLAWGWQDGPGGLRDTPVLALRADLDLACATSFTLLGEIPVGRCRARVRLQAQGEAVLAARPAREQAEPAMLEVLAPAVMRWRCPFTVEMDPVAEDSGAVCHALGPCTGAIVGEAGLRPRQAGSGWQWFVHLHVEPVLAPAVVHDPVLGRTHKRLALLPSVPLVDWSLG